MKQEGKLRLDIAGLDKNVLNVVGAKLGLDFGNTSISFANEITLAKAGKSIAASGQFAANNFGVTFDSVKTGRFADAVTISRPKTPEELAVFQRMVDWIYQEFVGKVAEGRKLTREAVEEIPFEDDFRMFFKQFPQPCIGYWHDTGHGQIKENIGFINHVDHVHAMSPRMHGFHIHDVQWAGRDHVPPGMGMINFAALKPFVKPVRETVTTPSSSGCRSPSRTGR